MTHAPGDKEKLSKPEVLIITGLSGAGKTCVMRALEDLGFYCVDNLPMPLISPLLDLTLNKRTVKKIALGVDARADFFTSNFTPAVFDEIKKAYQHCAITIIFINAQKNTLLKRFQETRRNHPLADGLGLDRAIAKEMLLLEPISTRSDMVIDTDLFTPHDLRRLIRTSFESDHEPRKLIVKLMSFGFKYGVPPESNLVYDLRFLPNPYFSPDLRNFNGTSAIIDQFLFSHQEVQSYWENLRNFLHLTLKNFYQEGRFFVTVSIGCTGGKHRSVCFTEKINAISLPNVTFLLSHRDINRDKTVTQGA